MKTNNGRSENGQSLIIFAILSVVFIGLLAVALDVGYAYAIRRSAQNAADAGALAGASTLCGTGDEPTRQTAAVTEAMKFAGDDGVFASTNKVPGRTSQAATVNQAEFTQQKVGVTVTVDYNTVLGGIYGQPTNTIQAYAKAGCKPGGITEGALPIAKDCGTLIPIPGSNPPSFTCSDVEINPKDDQCHMATDTSVPLADRDKFYVFINDSAENLKINATNSTEQYVCSKEYMPNSGQIAVNCDSNNDNTDDMDVASTGNASKDKWMWVDLSPGTNCTDSNCLNQVVQGQLNFYLSAPLWVPGGSGAKTSVYKNIENYRKGDIVAVPVFNWTCIGTDPEFAAKCSPHGWIAGDQKHVDSGGNDSNYFRIVAYAFLKITDVCWGGACDKPNGSNPARFAMFQQPFKYSDGSSGGPVSTKDPTTLNGFEGCFVRMTTSLVSGVTNSGVDTGVYSVYLIK